MYPVHSLDEFKSAIAANTSFSVALSGRSTRIELIPTSLQSRCFPPTYDSDPGSLPTKTVPSPGVIPLALSAATRLVRSALMADASALPSRICALMSKSYLFMRVKNVGFR